METKKPQVLGSSPSAPNLSGPPKDWSEDDKLTAAKWISTKPLTEIRQRQGIIRSQIAAVYQQLETPVFHGRELQETAMANLRVMEEVEAMAVGMKCFPKET